MRAVIELYNVEENTSCFTQYIFVFASNDEMKFFSKGFIEVIQLVFMFIIIKVDQTV